MQSDAAIPLLDIYPKGMKTYPPKDFCTHIHTILQESDKFE